MAASSEWENLSLTRKVEAVSCDISKLLDDLQILTAPGGEVDSALDEAFQSFEPLFNLYGSNNDNNENDPQLPELFVQKTSNLSHSNKNQEEINKELEVFLSMRRPIQRKGENGKEHDLLHQSISSNDDLSEDTEKMTLQSDNSPVVSEEVPERVEVVTLKKDSFKESSAHTRKTFGTSVYESLSHYSTPRSKDDQDDDNQEHSRRDTSYAF